MTTSKLEVQISADIDGLQKAVEQSSKELDGLTAAQKRVGDGLRSLTQSAIQYEKALKDLNENYRKGNISQQQFAKESERLGTALGNNRSEVTAYQREQDRLAKQVDRARAAIERKATSTAKDTAATTTNTRATAANTASTQANTTATSRNVVAQRTALSASGNLTRAVVALSTGSGGATGSIAMMTRQLAQMGITSAAAGGGMSMLASSLMGPAGIAIAASAAVTAITGYVASQLSAKKATDDTTAAQREYTNSLREYISTQDAVSRSTVKGIQDTTQEIAMLKALYAVATDTTVSIDKRKKAVDQLQKQYPNYFGNIDREILLTGQAAANYRRLTNDILASGKARAAARLQAESYDEIVAIELRREKRQERQVKLANQLSKITDEITEKLGVKIDFFDESQVTAARDLNRETNNTFNSLITRGVKVKQQLDEISKERSTDGLREISLYQDIDKLQKSIIENVKAGGDLVGATTNKITENKSKIADYAEQIAKILAQSDNTVSLLNTNEFEAETEKIKLKYEAMYSSLSKIEKKILDDTKLSQQQRTKFFEESAKVRTQLAINEMAEISHAEIREAQRSQEIIDRILKEAGVNRIKSKEDELAANKKYYDDLVELHKDNADILLAISEARMEAEKTIREKWAPKIEAISIDYTRRTNETRSQMLIRQLNAEFKKRVEQANKEVKTEQDKLRRQAQLQEEYWRRLDAIRKIEGIERAAVSMGDAIGNAFERTLSDGTDIFKALGDEFKRMIVRMVADAARLQAIKLFNSLMGNSDTGDNTSSTQGVGQWVSALSGVFASGGSGGQWLNGFSNSFGSNGAGGQWLSSFANTFSSSGNGGQWLSALGSMFSSGGSAGGWLNSLITGLFGRGGGFSGWGGYNPIPFNMRPINDFGGGRFTTPAPVTNPGFIPGFASGNRNVIKVVVEGQISGNDIRISNARSSKLNARFNGGQ